MQKKLLRICLILAMSIIFSSSSFASVGWIGLDDGSWVYYNEDGTIATNSWKKSGGCWYYLGNDGKWIVQAPLKTGVSDNIYTNADLRYSINIPSEAEYSIPINKLTIEIKGDLYGIMIYNFPRSGNSMEEIIADAEEWYGYCMDTVSTTSYSEISKMDVQVGEYTLRKIHRLNKNSPIGLINYLCIQENGFFIINASYYSGELKNLENIESIVNSLSMNK